MSPLGAREAPRPPDKSPDAFRTISEVAEDLDIPQHVLRFWETRFAQIKPLKRGGGRRYYRPDDIDLLKGIRHLLYGEGYTIKGVQRILKEDGLRFVQSIGRGEQAIDAPAGQPDRREPLDEHVDRAGPEDEDPDQARATAGFQAAPPPVLQSAPASGGPSLSPSDIGRLRSAVQELLECERVLKALNAPERDEDSDGN